MNERSTRIQDEPESTIGRKPSRPTHPERPEHGRARSGSASREAQRDEREDTGRDVGEPPTLQSHER